MVKVAGESETEQKILAAAKAVFVRNGLDGSRMQQIADEAGINKALLHYYFRSKDHLFMMVFSSELQKFFPRLLPILASHDVPIKEKVALIVESYNNLFNENPYLPVFILSEINRDSLDFSTFLKLSGVDVQLFNDVLYQQFREELGFTRDEVTHFIVNLLSLCVLPFIARPILEQAMFEGDCSKYDTFLIERNQYVNQFVNDSFRQRQSDFKERKT